MQRRVSTDNGVETLVFSGPGAEYDILRTISDGAVVTITGKTTEDYTELADGGWVLSLWLESL